MKLRNRLTLTATLILISGAVWGHSGHEDIGDVLHIEYLLSIGIVVVIGLYQVMKHKQDRRD